MEAIDITAALARCAMSRIESDAVLGGAGSMDGAGAAAARRTRADPFDFGASACLAVSTGAVGASASFGVSGSGAGATPCADDAAKRSLKESEGSAGTVAGVAGAGVTGGVSRRAICEVTGAMRAAKLAGGLATCASKLLLSSCGYGPDAKTLA